MQEEDDTVEKIERKLKRQQCYNIAFGICFLVSTLEYLFVQPVFGIGMRYSQSDTVAYVWLVWKYFGEIIQIAIMI